MVKWASNGKHVDYRLIKDLECLYVDVDTGYDRCYPYKTEDGFPECIVGVDEHNSVLYVRNDMLNTCHPKATGGSLPCCSACGEPWGVFYVTKNRPPKFCPNCGSRIISEETD